MDPLTLAKSFMNFSSTQEDRVEEIFNKAQVPAKERLKTLITEEAYELYVSSPESYALISNGFAWLICYYVCFCAKNIEDGDIILVQSEFGEGKKVVSGENELQKRIDKYFKEAKALLHDYLKKVHKPTFKIFNF